MQLPQCAGLQPFVGLRAGGVLHVLKLAVGDLPSCLQATAQAVCSQAETDKKILYFPVDVLAQ